MHAFLVAFRQLFQMLSNTAGGVWHVFSSGSEHAGGHQRGQSEACFGGEAPDSGQGRHGPTGRYRVDGE